MYTLPNLFRPYIEGREAAIKNNWQDLSNFNLVLKGQMENALYGETMGDAADISHDRAAREHINTVLSAANFPVGLQAASLGQYAQSTYGKGLVDAKMTNQVTGQNLAAQNNMQNMDLSRLKHQLDSNELKLMIDVLNNKLTPEERIVFGKLGLGFPQPAPTTATTGVAAVTTGQNPEQPTNPDIASFKEKQAALDAKEQPQG